jgi:hypothetical protein
MDRPDTQNGDVQDSAVPLGSRGTRLMERLMSQPPYPGPPNPSDPFSGPPNSGQPPYSGQPYQPEYPPTTPYPSSGQPDYGQQPSYGQQPPPQQPQYGQQQPGYQPPGYGQQPPQQPPYGAPQPGYGQPSYGAPQPPKKSRTLPIILVSVAIVLVLCVGGVTALYMVGKNKVDDVNNAINDLATTAPTFPTTDEPTTAPTTEAPTTTVTISEPTTLGGRKKLTSAQFKALADQLKSGLETVPGATNTVGALYGDVQDQDIVIVAAAEAPVKNPKTELDQTFYGAGIGGLKIDNITTAPTGTLGGVAKCGSSETSGIDMAICTWADEGSVGMFIWYFSSVSSAKAEFPKLRAQVEKKG